MHPIKLICLVLFVIFQTSSAFASSGVAWQKWDDAIFVRAKQENRLVLLDLEAVWCHWCHVMEEKTYSDPEIQKILREKFIAVKVDQDSRPDLANRYLDYGWPATVVFNANGEELSKNAGFMAPEEMLPMLRSLAENPRPLLAGKPSTPPSAGSALLSSTLRKELKKRHRESFDEAEGGLKLRHKYLDSDNTEYSLWLAAQGDVVEKDRALKTLKAAQALLDPAWGGVYQYSTGGTWTNPHFEKILSSQTENLKIYAKAYALWKDPSHRIVAERIHDYLTSFLLAPEGAFFTSQDADLKPGEHSAEYFSLNDMERRRLGVPRVDRHLYSRENGWVIEALVELYLTTGNIESLERAKRSADWILAHRSLAASPYQWIQGITGRGIDLRGGFRHDDQDAGGPFLGDSLFMGRAFLSLYLATGERAWLERAVLAADFIDRNFKSASLGYNSSLPSGILQPQAQLDENIALARFANLLFHYTGELKHREMAGQAMGYLALPEVALDRLSEAGILLADLELAGDPAHVTVVGSKDDSKAIALFRAAASLPLSYKRIEWWDTKEGPLPNPDVKYPQLNRSAAFVCANKLCSSPVFRPEEILVKVQRLAKP